MKSKRIKKKLKEGFVVFLLLPFISVVWLVRLIIDAFKFLESILNEDT